MTNRTKQKMLKERYDIEQNRITLTVTPAATILYAQNMQLIPIIYLILNSDILLGRRQNLNLY